MLWHLDGTQVHLLGSIHILDEPGCRLSGAAEAAFLTSRVVVFEHDNNPNPGIFLNPPGVSLSTRVPRSTFVKASMAWQNLRQQNRELELRSPWAAALAIGVKRAENNGFKAELGVEAALRFRAGQAGKAMQVLETPENALQGLIDGPDPEQVEFLDYASRPDAPFVADVVDMANAWRHGEEAVFERIRKHRLHLCPQMFEPFINGRNRAWMPALVSLIHQNTPVFVVVGAMHCVGENGLPHLLRDVGQPVSRAD